MKNRQNKVVLSVLSILFGTLLFSLNAQADMIEDGKTVGIDYTLTIDGVLVESSEGKEPLQYVHGQNQIIPGLSAALEGMKEGEEKNVVISPEDGYGEVNQQAFREINRDQFPADQELQQGQVIQITTPEGTSIPGIIWQIRDETIVVNFNHPLAGKTLNFDVKVVSIE